MKFGQNFYRYLVPEWESRYVNYNLLKVLCKRATNSASQLGEEPDFKDFSSCLESSLYDIEQFRIVRAQALDFDCTSLYKAEAHDIESFDPTFPAVLLRAVAGSREDCFKLERYTRVNHEAIERIYIKLERHGCSDNPALQRGQRRWLALHDELKALISSHLEKLDTIVDEIRSNVNAYVSSAPKHHFDGGSGSPTEAAYRAIMDHNDAALADVIEKGTGDIASVLSRLNVCRLLKLSITYSSKACLKYLLSKVQPDGQPAVDSELLFHFVITNLLKIASASNRSGESQPTDSLLGRGTIKRHMDMFVWLVDQLGRDRNNILAKHDPLGRSLLHYAARYGLTEICQLLSRYQQQNERPKCSTPAGVLAHDMDGHTPLHLAVIHGHCTATTILLELVVDQESRKEREEGALKLVFRDLLHIAIRYRHQDIARCILAQGVDVTYKSGGQEKTAVYVAAELGDRSCLELLLEPQMGHLINLDVAEVVYGWTPLMAAAVNGHAEVIAYLLSAGANEELRDKCGWTAQAHAAFRGHMEIAERLSVEKQGGFIDQRTDSRKQSTKVNTGILPQVGRHGCLAINLGTMHTSRHVKAVDLDDCPFEYTPDSTGSYSMEISAPGNSSATNLLRLPVLADMCTEPVLFPIECLGNVEVEFKVYRDSPRNETGEVLFCAGSTILGNEHCSLGTKHQNLVREHTVSLLAKDTMRLAGTVTFTYVIMRPFQYPAVAPALATPFPRRDAVQLVGHRGLGLNVASHERLQVGENTAQSFLSAANLGAQFVEFDVQVTRDLEPVIYHDFSLSESGTDVPIHELTREQFLHAGKVQLPPSIHCQNRPRSKSLSEEYGRGTEDIKKKLQLTVDFHKKGFKPNSRGQFIQGDFATLEHLLQALPEYVGFAVELKYPRLHEALGADVAPVGIEINQFVDCVLDKIFQLARNRHIILSSFTPEVCMLLALKQKEFPVMLITNAGKPPRVDMEKRGASLQVAIRFAKKWNLFGIVVAAEPLLFFLGLIEHVKASGLVCASYGLLNNDPNNVKLQVKAGLDMIIADEVGVVAKTLKQVNESEVHLGN